MALAATIVFEIRTGGSDLNGGGFNSTAGGTDRSQQTTPQVTIDNAAITCTTPAANSNTLTFTLGYVPSAADVGNLVNIAGGTNINAGVYEITAAAGATWTLAGAANLTTAGGAGSAITGRMGGCMASPGKVGSVMVAGNDLYVRQATYNISSATQNITNGCLKLPAGASANNVSKVIGYTTTRGDGAPTRPIFLAGAINTFTLLDLTNNATHGEGIEVDGNNTVLSRGIDIGNNGIRVYNCVARNCTNAGFSASGNNSKAIGCYATGCATVAAFNGVDAYDCTAIANTITGFQAATTGCLTGCLSANNTGATTDGVVGAAGATIRNCTSYGNGRNGFSFGAANNVHTAINCLAVNNAAKGFFSSTNPHDNTLLINCAGYNNATGNVDSASLPAAQQINFVTLTGDPFANAAGLNFSANTTAGAGAALRSAGYPSTLPGTATNNYADIGVARHLDPSGGAAGSGAGSMRMGL
jgi:hypothetical protein